MSATQYSVVIRLCLLVDFKAEMIKNVQAPRLLGSISDLARRDLRATASPLLDPENHSTV